MFIGITGGIGAGKSTVLHRFAECGGNTADADDVAHGLYEQGAPAYLKMVERWGQGVLAPSGTIDRKAVAKIVFASPAEREWLNQLIHPLIREKLQSLEQSSTAPFYCAVPLLFETGWEKNCDAVVATWCPADVQHLRLLARGWTEKEIAGRLATQLSMDEKLRRADFGIVTNCSWQCLAAQCQKVHEAILKRMSPVM